jgi:hypothetical protein
LPKQRSQTTIELAIMDYLQDHEGGNHSKKTVQWHQTALGLFQLFLANERDITLVGEIDSSDVSAWFAYMRKIPVQRSWQSGKYWIPATTPLILALSKAMALFSAPVGKTIRLQASNGSYVSAWQSDANTPLEARSPHIQAWETFSWSTV